MVKYYGKKMKKREIKQRVSDSGRDKKEERNNGMKLRKKEERQGVRK